MLDEEQIQTALRVERRMYALLLEVMDVTNDLCDAVNRQDQVSVRMFLKMRKDTLLSVMKCKEELQIQCNQLDPVAFEQMQQILSNQPCQDVPVSAVLSQQVDRNQALLRRIVKADQAISQRLGGKRSFYQQHPDFP